MYGKLPSKKWQKWFGITKDNRPDVAIVWGIFSSIMEEGFWTVPEFLLAHFEKYLRDIRKIKLPHTFVGKYKNLKIAVTHAYGGAFSLDQVLKLKKLGARLIILIGHFGGLKKMPVGKMFIPSAAYRSDGASYHLLGEDDRFVHPTSHIEQWLQNYLKKEKISFETGVIKTVSTMTGQEPRMIEEWKRDGFVGVDLESAVLFTVGKKENVNCVSILHHSDHVGGGKLIFDTTTEEKKAKKTARRLLVKIALAVAEKFGK